MYIILCSSLNEMLSFTYDYLHISWTPSLEKSQEKVSLNCIKVMCVCLFFFKIIIIIYIYLFYITWVCYFVVYDIFSEPEIILYYKCDVSMNHDINVLCYV